ncbi:hypothetical protein GCM10010341_44910 [Streptomyces noursei]|nr:hypothetical protein GCM10010341_44910 [Streptomyces noursei]
MLPSAASTTSEPRCRPSTKPERTTSASTGDGTGATGVPGAAADDGCSGIGVGEDEDEVFDEVKAGLPGDGDPAPARRLVAVQESRSSTWASPSRYLRAISALQSSVVRCRD